MPSFEVTTSYREAFNHHVEVVFELLILLTELLLGGCRKS
jgi:hypothetical protein